jgi:hypothetical protein
MVSPPEMDLRGSIENLCGRRDSTPSSVHSGLASGESPRFVFLKPSPSRGLKNTKDPVEGIEILHNTPKWILEQGLYKAISDSNPPTIMGPK